MKRGRTGEHRWLTIQLGEIQQSSLCYCARPPSWAVGFSLKMAPSPKCNWWWIQSFPPAGLCHDVLCPSLRGVDTLSYARTELYMPQLNKNHSCLTASWILNAVVWLLLLGSASSLRDRCSPWLTFHLTLSGSSAGYPETCNSSLCCLYQQQGNLHCMWLLPSHTWFVHQTWVGKQYQDPIISLYCSLSTENTSISSSGLLQHTLIQY